MISDENELRRQQSDSTSADQSSQQADVPFVQNDIANMTALRRAIRPPAFYDTNAQVFPPLIVKVDKKSRSVRYIDLGLPSARSFWERVVLVNYEELKRNPCPASTFNAAVAIWHLKDWIWHEQHPAEETRSNKVYEAFEAKLFDDCPELAWVRQVADASKHRGLSRNLNVREIRNDWPHTMVLDDGSTYDLLGVLSNTGE